jgi:hypothetical protein
MPSVGPGRCGVPLDLRLEVHFQVCEACGEPVEVASPRSATIL